MMVLITNKNKPNVKNVTGIVSNTNIGFINVFSSDRIRAVVIAATKLSTRMASAFVAPHDPSPTPTHR